MNFLNPAILFAALAALVPLIIHLFSRRRVKVVEFSSLKHLKRMQRRQVRRLKVRQWLLLLLRMLIILAAVLAFARPTTEGGHVGSHASVSAVIVLDNSASMTRYVTDGSLMELARKRTEELLATFGDADEVCILTMDDDHLSKENIGLTSVAVARERLHRLEPTSTEMNLEAAMDKAADLLEAAVNVNKELYLVTDRQRHSLPDRQSPRQLDIRVYFVDLPLEDTENCGVVSVDLGGELLLPGHEFEMVATVRNYGGRDRSDVIASLFLDGARVAQDDVDIRAEQSATVRFTRSVSRGGFHAGYVEISDDRLTADNRYYFSFFIPETFNVLLVSGDPSSRFIAMALTPSPTLNLFWSVKDVSPSDLGAVRFWDYDVLVLAGAPTLPDMHYERLRGFVNGGKSLFVTYGGSTDTEDFNSRWTPVTGVVFEEPVRRDFSRAGYYTLDEVDMSHPVFSVYEWEDNKPPEIKFFALPQVRAVDGAKVVARFSGGRPALVETTYGEGRVLTLTGPVSPEYSDLTGHALFVPLVTRAVEYLSARLSRYDLNLYCGDNVTRDVNLSGTVGGTLQLITPDSGLFDVPPEEERGNLVVKPRPLKHPGIYRVSHLGRDVDWFAVNMRPEEGDLTAADPEQYATGLGLAETRLLDYDAGIGEAVTELRYGKELWQLFLWLGVVLLSAEMLLARGTSAEESP